MRTHVHLFRLNSLHLEVQMLRQFAIHRDGVPSFLQDSSEKLLSSLQTTAQQHFIASEPSFIAT